MLLIRVKHLLNGAINMLCKTFQIFKLELK